MMAVALDPGAQSYGLSVNGARTAEFRPWYPAFRHLVA
ncbi:MAG: hypothetical protein JWM18_2862 [Chloroflexi bacterium]|jgi:hypothetical protein|nr:hypothetical protein [Chloroflexota bacterium]